MNHYVNKFSENAKSCKALVSMYTTHNKLRIFGYGFKFVGELYMSCTNDFVCDHYIVLWYEMYLFGVVSFIVFAWHACKEQGVKITK